MGLASVQAEVIKKVINFDPATVTVKRIERINMGGYFSTQESVLGTFIVRIFRPSQKNANEKVSAPGKTYEDESWGLMGDASLPLNPSSRVQEIIETQDEIKFEVIPGTVYEQREFGEKTGVMARLRRVM